MTGLEETASSCYKGGLSWILGILFFLFSSGKVCLGQWWSPHPWRDLTDVWMWHLGTWVGGGLGRARGSLALLSQRAFPTQRFCSLILGSTGDGVHVCAMHTCPDDIYSQTCLLLHHGQWLYLVDYVQDDAGKFRLGCFLVSWMRGSL